MKSDDIDVVVSFATHKSRIERGRIYQFLDSILEQTYQGKFHVVANIWRPDYDNAPQRLKDTFAENDVEVWVSDTNYKTFLKSCHTFSEYKDVPVITVDDDMVYKKDMVQRLMHTHRRFPNVIVGGLCKIQGVDEDNKFLRFESQPWVMSGTKPGYRGTRAIGSGGILFPSEFHNRITIDDINNWIEKNNSKPDIKYNDDMFIYEMCVKYHTYVMPVIYEPLRWNGYLVERTLNALESESGGWKLG